MKDRLGEQKVQVYKAVDYWRWVCQLHDCPSEVVVGFSTRFEVTVHFADQHARRNHGHRHLPHDLG